MRQFDVRLWAIFTVPATSKKITHFRSGQKLPKNKNLAYFTKVKSKSPIHTVVVTGLRLGNRVLTNTKVKKSLFHCSISYCKQDSKEFFVFRWVPFQFNSKIPKYTWRHFYAWFVVLLDHLLGEKSFVIWGAIFLNFKTKNYKSSNISRFDISYVFSSYLSVCTFF